MENPNGVDTKRLRKEIRQALFVAEFVYERHGESLVLLHTYDGQHKTGSLHYKHRAVDLGLPGGIRYPIEEELNLILGSEYDVIFESDHVHIEWDPK
jgi:hypothetical protein